MAVVAFQWIHVCKNVKIVEEGDLLLAVRLVDLLSFSTHGC